MRENSYDDNTINVSECDHFDHTRSLIIFKILRAPAGHSLVPNGIRTRCFDCNDIILVYARLCSRGVRT